MIFSKKFQSIKLKHFMIFFNFMISEHFFFYIKISIKFDDISIYLYLYFIRHLIHHILDGPLTATVYLDVIFPLVMKVKKSH